MPKRKGDIVDVVISKIHHYGLDVNYQGQIGLVLITNITWDPFEIRGKELEDLFQVNQKVKVKILVDDHAPFSASIKDVNPLDNPWLNVEKLKIGDVVSVTIIREVEFGFFVEIKKGLIALLPSKNVMQPRETGETIKVRLTSINFELRQIEVTEI